MQTMLMTGEVENVRQGMKRMKVNILRLPEMRWKEAVCVTSDGYKVLNSRGDHDDTGVGVILNPETFKAIDRFWTVSDKVIIAKLQGKPLDIGLIQVCAPTVDTEEE